MFRPSLNLHNGVLWHFPLVHSTRKVHCLSPFIRPSLFMEKSCSKVWIFLRSRLHEWEKLRCDIYAEIYLIFRMKKLLHEENYCTVKSFQIILGILLRRVSGNSLRRLQQRRCKRVKLRKILRIFLELLCLSSAIESLCISNNFELSVAKRIFLFKVSENS